MFCLEFFLLTDYVLFEKVFINYICSSLIPAMESIFTFHAIRIIFKVQFSFNSVVSSQNQFLLSHSFWSISKSSKILFAVKRLQSKLNENYFIVLLLKYLFYPRSHFISLEKGLQSTQTDKARNMKISITHDRQSHQRKERRL